MAKVEFNVAWWKKHSAKTLTDTGMSEALRKWEGADKRKAVPTIAALQALHKAAVTAEKKANKTLHKETIGYLRSYLNMCDDFTGELEKANENSMVSVDKILTRSMVIEISKDKEGQMFADELTYLLVTKGNPKAASEVIYDTFIKANAPRQVNISGADRTACDDLAAAGTWEGDAWERARNAIMLMITHNLKGIQSVLESIEAEPMLKEIRAA